MKRFLKEYFSFTNTQSKAVIALIILIFVSSILYFLMPQLVAKGKRPLSDDLKMMQLALIEDDVENSYQTKKQTRPPAKLTPFKFNPNTLDEAGFRRLGLPDKLVSTLLNYRNKGGKFYNAESLHRIYGLHEEEFQQLEPYIDIPNAYARKFESKPKPNLHIELNGADTSELVKLRGIGSKLAMNIVKKRESLGGFANIEQLKEVFGISSETFELVKSSIYVNQAKIVKLNLNEATYYELNAHPYLRGEIATALVEFRKSHNYQIDNLNQLKEISLINAELFRKIVPYLSL